MQTVTGLSLAVLAPLAVGLSVLASSRAATLATFGLAAVAVAHSLARQEAARRALEYSERRHRTLVEELPLVAYAARLVDSRVEYVSPQIARLLDLTAEQALHEHDFWTPRLHALDRDRVLREWHAWGTHPSLEPFRQTYRMLTDGGRVIWVEDVTILVGDRADKQPRFQRHLLDVSEPRQLVEQLREAQKFEALGRLASGVAHDFNNLLGVIGGHSERLASRLLESTQRESAVAIGAAADRGAALVRQLLSFSRPRPSDHRLIDLNTLVGEFVPMLRRVVGEDIELELVFERHPLPVEVDPARIDQVLMNLVVNARDAMPDGGRLTIATAAVAVDEAANDGVTLGRTAVVAVSDTGAGMDAETRERIFEPFFTTKESGKGSGLGLAIASGIVSEANGTLVVFSAPGRGTTFRIHLPLAGLELEPEIEPVAEPATPLGGPETVLLVEDEASVRALEQMTLEDAGYRVHPAADAAEALELARRYMFDLLLADVVMPGMSGPQLVEELHARGCDLPTIFVSGYGSDEFSSRGVHAANAAVVQKPFHRNELLGKVREVLDGAATNELPGAPDSSWEFERTLDAFRRSAGARARVLGAPVRPAEPAAGAPAARSLSVRCLTCSARYERLAGRDTAAPSCCPRCEYVGWATVE
jgi:signal transduction histidine kinase/DNA-binding response OmpR family regulator